jgi:DNA-directed RNA polymerase
MDAALRIVPSRDESTAAIAELKLRDDTLKFAAKWLEFGIDRKTAKRPVMTLPYGSTRQSCTQYIFQAILEKDKDFFGKNQAFKAAVWLTTHMWAAIGEVVIAATEAMEWLQQCASAMNKVGKPLAWKTPDGFVAYQHSTVIETIKINTQLAGRFQIRIGTHTDILDKNKQRLGIAPNFVHSHDGCHLRMTVRRARELGVQDFALIHDDYGSHCANTAKLHQAIREAFVDMYKNNDPIENFKKVLEACGAKVPPVPRKGILDIDDVLKADYFFG